LLARAIARCGPSDNIMYPFDYDKWHVALVIIGLKMALPIASLRGV
jgi:hypothetical protein